MPWWGWLIGFGVVICCATVVIVVVIMTRAVATMSREADDSHELWRRQHGLGRAGRGRE